MRQWRSFLGVRPQEAQTVWLFFLHNFLLGVGTILIYVAANVILLEESPERNLPLAYAVAALAMIVVGRVYAYYEHHVLLKRLVVRTLLVVVVLTVLLAGLLLLGPSVAAAIMIMTGYRLIYLLTSLEFWGVSAVVFNVRQGRRLFSVISSGDMPAKALGALLAVFVHAYADLYFLLLAAGSLYLFALLVQQATFRRQAVDVRLKPRVVQSSHSVLMQHLSGGSWLVWYMGLSLLTIAAVGAGVEYFFLINVKQKLQDQATVLQYVAGVLTLTYLLAMVGKLLLTRHSLDRLGVRWTLLLLPLVAVAGVALFGPLQAAGAGPTGQLVYFCGLYLGLEVLRRTLFEPAFLVLFQPLTPTERLQGHSLVKAMYEPVGLGIAGLLLLSLSPTSPSIQQGVSFGWMGLGLVAAVFLLQRTYRQYLNELKGSLGLRFTDSLSPTPTPPEQCSANPPLLGSQPELRKVLEFLQRAEPAELQEHAAVLLRHPDARVRNRVLMMLGPQADAVLLRRLALDDPDPMLRKVASRLASRHSEVIDLLDHPDLVVRTGAIQGRLEADSTDLRARTSLAELVTATTADCRLAVTELVGLLPSEQQVGIVVQNLRSLNPELVKATVQAISKLPAPTIAPYLLTLLHDKATRKSAADCLVRLGTAATAVLQAALRQETDPRALQQLTSVCARLATPASRQVLVRLVQGPNLFKRAAALRALSSYASEPTDAPLFHHVVEEELTLAQHLLHGMHEATAELRNALRYELQQGQQRLFGVLLQLYERQPLLDAQRSVRHATRERQANALEMLDNLIPRPLYQGLQALVDVSRLQEKMQVFDDLLGPVTDLEPVQTLLVRRGADAFSAWTLSVALRQWHPTPDTVVYLPQHLQAASALVRESAAALLQQLPTLRPAAFDQLLALHPTISTLPMTDHSVATRVSARERVLMLKGTTLFAETSENVLSAIVPIMKEVVFAPNEQIFAKGELGTSLFIVYEGEVGIFAGPLQLTRFGRGDFFGELALLDAEPRSATAVALQPVVAFRLDQDDFYDVMEECMEVVHNILRVLCHRLRRQNESAYSMAAVSP